MLLGANSMKFKNLIAKKIFILVFFITMFVYAVKSTVYIWNFMSKESVLAEDYKILSNQLVEMNKEINNLEVKVNGLREDSVNQDVLELQAKKMLNMAKKGEIIIVK
jgi:cell division protein FtsB